MKRRLSTLLGALAAATLISVVVPTSAQAVVHDELVINGVKYPNPKGCINLPGLPRELEIYNDTTRKAVAFPLPGCNGLTTGTLNAGKQGTTLGSSVLMGS
ncbi:hypothetical protein [Streptomyces aureoversilis]|uniref:Secreted protein n=1 Tax=Streptomyces aureoversilis TaxID=67277 RepID=A0ABW0A598_9ACTN